MNKSTNLVWPSENAAWDGYRKTPGDCCLCECHVRSGPESSQDSARPFVQQILFNLDKEECAGHNSINTYAIL